MSLSVIIHNDILFINNKHFFQILFHIIVTTILNIFTLLFSPITCMLPMASSQVIPRQSSALKLSSVISTKSTFPSLLKYFLRKLISLMHIGQCPSYRTYKMENKTYFFIQTGCNLCLFQVDDLSHSHAFLEVSKSQFS